MLQLRPILSTLRRHRTAALLIVVEIALTCAIVCNAVFLIANRIERAAVRQRPGRHRTGAPGHAQHRHDANDVGGHARGPGRVARVAGRAQRGHPVDAIPFGHESRNTGISMMPGQPAPTIEVAMYNGDVGLRRHAGPEDGRRPRLPGPTRSSTRRPFDKSDDSNLAGRDRHPGGGRAPVSRAATPWRKSIYLFSHSPMRIVGVVDRLITPHPDQADKRDLYSVILPMRPTFDGGTYVLRTDPAQRDAVLKAAVATLERVNPHRVAQEHGTFEDLRGDYYKSDLAMVWLLAGVCVALLVVTAFGIVGLASFWVQQRTRMIGTRRALGATRGQILRYFQTENLLLTSAGIALGMVGAFAINQWLMTQYELPRLPVLYLPLGALVLWALGQVAVLAPARRAAALPPAHAMRGLA